MEYGTEIELENYSEFSDAVVLEALQSQIPELYKAEIAKIDNTVRSWSGSASRRSNSTIFNQDVYSIPDGIFDQMRTAVIAAKYDDVVSNALETTENLAVKRLLLDCGDDDLNDIMSQIIDDIDLPQRMREIWRDLFTVSQCYVAVKWGRKSYKPKNKNNKTNGRSRKKVYKDILVPLAISTLDPLKIIPVGDFLFGDERLIYVADEYEAESINNRLNDPNRSDMNVNILFEKKYTPAKGELESIERLLGNYGRYSNLGTGDRLFLLNEDNVWRITASRQSYQRFADVRMASVFPLLDLKHNQRESDRSDLLGNIHCLVVVKKGNDERPATEQELIATSNQIKQSSRNSIMISDHRLEVEIITKKNDKTLQPERHNMLDSRITSRLYQTLNTGNYSSGTQVDDSPKLFKVIASSMEARRDNIREAIMDNIFDRMWEKNEFNGDPKLHFQPRRISLDFDINFATLITDLHAEGVVSTETVLDMVDLNIDDEASKREREDEMYANVFEPRIQPGQALTPEQQGRLGGGNQNGGGMNSSSGKSSPSDNPKSATQSEKNKAASSTN